MFTPDLGAEAPHRALLSTLSEAGGKICPPVVVGLGVGGNAEVATLLAKKALLRPLDGKNPDRELARIERKLEGAANALGIGPMGLGGKSTVLRVFIERVACHSATLPVAVAFQCWPARRAKAKLEGGRLRVIEP
jgi:fumarate hydratase subunit alpha